MKFHIVQMNETIDEIVFLYNLEKDELKEENRHIRKWDKLIPGTKLKIPVISEAVDSEVTEMEPFIEDYYPKVKVESEALVDEKIEEDQETVEVNADACEEETINNNDIKEETFKKEEPVKMEENITYESKETKNSKSFSSPIMPYLYVNPYYAYYYYNRARIVYPAYYYPMYYKKK